MCILRGLAMKRKTSFELLFLTDDKCEEVEFVLLSPPACSLTYLLSHRILSWIWHVCMKAIVLKKEVTSNSRQMSPKHYTLSTSEGVFLHIREELSMKQ